MMAKEMLVRGVDLLGYGADGAIIERLWEYLLLLEKWNKVYNLTAIRSLDAMVSNHLLDSLAIVPYVEAKECADVGSGAGLPGIVLALAKPDVAVTLLESNSKKTAFLQQAKIELGLANLRVVTARAESWQPEKKFPLIVSRAFSSLADFATVTRGLCAEDGELFAMKGQLPAGEIEALPDWVRVERIIPLAVPGLDAERHLVVMKFYNL